MYKPYLPIFFYDKFTEEDIAGLFGIEHLIYIVAVLSVVALLIFLSRNISDAKFKKIHTALAITITVCEVIKIFLNIYKGAPYDYWLPLYYCGLFNFAVWLSRSKRDTLRRIGFSYITLGGIFAGLFFTVYPSTVLTHYPIYHPATIHAAFFHGAMLYLGITALLSGAYKPNKADLREYFLFVTAACLVALILNAFLGTNCMFLRDPFKLPLLTELNDLFPPFYIIIAWLGQAYVLPMITLYAYKLIGKHAQKDKAI